MRAWSYSLRQSATSLKWDHFGGVDTPFTVPWRAPRLYHIAISFRDEGEQTPDRVREYRRRSYKIARQHGLVGGVAVYHAGREMDRYELGGPHVHMVALGCNITPGGESDDESTGEVVFKVIPLRGDDGQVTTWFARSQREVARILSYVLTHTVTGPGFHSLTYFGALAYNCYAQSLVDEHIKRGMVEVSERADWCRCPFCGSDDVSSYSGMDWTDPCSPMSYFFGPGPPHAADLPLVTREIVANRTREGANYRQSVEMY